MENTFESFTAKKAREIALGAAPVEETYIMENIYRRCKMVELFYSTHDYISDEVVNKLRDKGYEVRTLNLDKGKLTKISW